MTLANIANYFDALEDPRCSINRLHPLTRVVVIAIMAILADANGLTAIAKHTHEPAAGVESVRAIVLRPAHDVIGRVRVERQALVLKRSQSVVHRPDRCRHL